MRIDEITEDNVRDYGLDAPRGVGIEGVLPGQPAAQAGIRAKDVILEVDGRAIASPRELQRVISITPVGTPVKVSLWRDGQAAGADGDRRPLPGRGRRAGAPPR